MTEYADKEICERLRRLSGWIDTFAWYNGDAIEFEGEAGYEGAVYENTMQYDWSTDIPAYTLAFILDKLPASMHSLTYEVTYRLSMKKIDDMYFFEYSNHGWFRDMKSVFARKGYDTSDESLAYGIKPVCSQNASSAAALLACTLFEQGVLKGAAQNGEGE